ncbi:MAG: HTTM domain-containing protein [Bacteroidota bacterium]
MFKQFINKIFFSFKGEKHIAPLAVLRIAFGAIMLISTIRFLLKGWVHEFYVVPKFFFPFYGFEWIKPLPALCMYIVFAAMAIAAFFILIGFLYRISITAFFLLFVYIELIDKTYYLNHYYIVSVISFLLMLVPANRYFSVDVMRKPSLKVTQVPSWTINIFKWQLCLIYFLAGLSKLNTDWMIEAMPLKIWLPANGNVPLIGSLMQQTWVAYAFSWFGAVFDLSVCFLLMYKPTRKAAYFLVILFHVFTALLFKIGMFPYIMIFLTAIFFPEEFHLKLIERLRNLFDRKTAGVPEKPVSIYFPPAKRKWLQVLLSIYILLQLFLPFRFLLYPGTLYWTEEGYRFSWRVMLMEKSGTTFFYVTDPQTGRRGEIVNARYLTPFQERMMETQPDMILQYAHYLRDVYIKKGIKSPKVTVESYVTLNGSGSRLFIDSSVDLSTQQESFLPKKWILPFQRKQ